MLRGATLTLPYVIAIKIFLNYLNITRIQRVYITEFRYKNARQIKTAAMKNR
jgi:hypothetical protein